MPVHAANLLTDLKKWVTRFEDDLRQQCGEVPELDARLKAQYKLAKDGGRTAFSYAVWRDGELTQSAVGWVLSCVFVRFLEDNDLLERPFLSGVGENRDIADETRAAWFREHRAASDNDYLSHVMAEVGKLPGMADLMDARHNALWNAAISPDAAKSFIEFWRRIDPGTGKMAHEFTDPDWDTRFLGDLYQDLSEAARKKFALLQTPDFVEEFILDRTLDPAINTFGLKVVRMIDPTCGSGHFLLGGFRRLLALWEKERPDLSDKERAVLALAGVYGVDINPFATAIARFRLLLAAWRYCGVRQLRSAPDFKVNLATGDSLIHGARFDSEGKPYVVEREGLFGGDDAAFKDETAHHFEVEDAKELHRILGQQYHAVVGNPPYITVKDKALSQLYRDRYDTCAGKYSLSVPFMERIFDLALNGDGLANQQGGFSGQITANSFMKAEFGKKLVNEYFRQWDITHVIDTSGVSIPGHGTPTVILFGRNRAPRTSVIRTVLGINGEPEVPEIPSRGRVWQAIRSQIDSAGSSSEWVSVEDYPSSKFHQHPWSIGGGGVSDLKDLIDSNCQKTVADLVETKRKKPNLGFASFPGLDEAFISDRASLLRFRVEFPFVRELVRGESVRDWVVDPEEAALAPYNSKFEIEKLDTEAGWFYYLWPNRTALRNISSFEKTREEEGASWWGWYRWIPEKYRNPLSITWGEVSTHNHFAFDGGGNVFKQSAPIMKLKARSRIEDHVSLLGVLNGSTAGFWLRQVCSGKIQGDGGKAHASKEGQRFNFTSTKVASFPLPELKCRLLPTSIVEVTEQSSVTSVFSQINDCGANTGATLVERLENLRGASQSGLGRLISLQEELDWQCYRHYGLIDPEDHLEWPEDRIDVLPALTLGERAFEIRMARQMAAGELESTWFERHKDAGSKPITELPAHWPDDYRALVERRLAFIEANKNINLIERPEYKRRWNTEPWAKRQQAALEKWLLTRLETYFHDADRMVSGEDEAATTAKLAHILPLRARFAGGSEPRLVSVRQLSQIAKEDSQWMEAATVFAGRDDFDVPKLVEKLVLAQSVPALPAQRYKPSGLRNRIEWEKTWALQRAEDEVEEEVRSQNPEATEEILKSKIRKAQLERVGEIPVPPKYKSTDFLKAIHWKLRGKLDVPKERWVVYPGAEGGHDESPVIAWAGWDHAQQAAALTGFYQQAKDTWAWTPERLAPLLASLKELLPWLHQWHNALDPEFGDRPCDSFQQFYDTELHALRMTDEDIEKLRMGSS